MSGGLKIGDPADLNVDEWLASMKEKILTRDENGKLVRQPEPRLIYSDFPGLLVVQQSKDEQKAAEKYLDAVDRMPRQGTTSGQR